MASGISQKAGKRLLDFDRLPHGAAVLFDVEPGIGGKLSWALGLFNARWRKRKRKAWHVGWIYRKVKGGYILFEALGDSEGGVQEKFRTTAYLRAHTQCYKWINRHITMTEMQLFVRRHKGCKYDVAVYGWTMAQYLLLKFIEVFQRLFRIKASISLPRVLNNKYTCWELLFQFFREMGKPIQEAVGADISRYPMISDLTDTLEGAPDD